MRDGSLLRVLRTDRWVRPFLKRYRGTLVLALALGLVTYLCAGALMFSSGYLISRAASLPENIMLIFVPIILTRAFGIGRPAFRYVERLTSHNWVLRMTSFLRLKLYSVLEHDAVFFRRKYRTGDMLGLLAEDIGHIQNLYLRTIFPTVIAWLLYAVIVIALGLFSWWFALAMLLMLGVAVFLIPLVSVLVNGARQAQRKQIKNELYFKLGDDVLGIADWVFSGRDKAFLNGYAGTQDTFNQIDDALNRYGRRRDLIVQMVFGGIAVSVLVWAGGHFVGNHGGAANWVAAFVLCVFPLIDAFAPLSAAAQDTNVHADSIKRLNTLPDKKETADKPAPQVAPPLTLRIEHVTFRYPETPQSVLNDFSLDIRSGEKLAILGRSGCGKSTLASLIRGDLQPLKGSVTLNGIPTARFGDGITKYMGMIQQDTYLFHTSVFNNIRIGRQSATEEDVWQVLEKVGMKQAIKRLPEGLDTLVDEAGLRFSGGERHRLALARVLLQDVPIILLDEPTVGLDPLMEQALLETFFKNLADKTVIWITHHLQGVSLMDRVIFIEEGRLALNGSPMELAKTNLRYQKLLAIERGNLKNV